VRIAFFVHSLVSDWNHGNAHFLRGVVRELVAAGHDVRVHEPVDSWSRRNLVRAHGARPLAAFAATFPELRSEMYDRDADVAALLDTTDVAVVHEWNEPWLVAEVGRWAPIALFHDTHHRAVTAPREMRRYDLSGYAGVLAATYRERCWHDRVHVWHEAADTRLFRPAAETVEPSGDLIWIGNWGDGERTRELHTYLLGPVRRASLTGSIFGVRYPAPALRAVAEAGLRYGGWLPNAEAPAAFSQHRVTVHVARRPYVEALPGIPTIRVFEALAAGIPLVLAPWEDTEGLFRPGDFLQASTGREMERLLRDVIGDPELARALAERGRETILARHTCAHRAAELLALIEELRPASRRTVAA
jgi:spore maturation protein CgeB